MRSHGILCALLLGMGHLEILDGRLDMSLTGGLVFQRPLVFVGISAAAVRDSPTMSLVSCLLAGRALGLATGSAHIHMASSGPPAISGHP